MKTQKTPPPNLETPRGTKWIEEGREQVREPEREGRQKGLAANPVHGQSWMSPHPLPPPRKHQPPFSFLIRYFAPQRADVAGAEGPGEQRSGATGWTGPHMDKRL